MIELTARNDIRPEHLSDFLKRDATWRTLLKELSSARTEIPPTMDSMQDLADRIVALQNKLTEQVNYWPKRNARIRAIKMQILERAEWAKCEAEKMKVAKIRVKIGGRDFISVPQPMLTGAPLEQRLEKLRETAGLSPWHAGSPKITSAG